MEVAAAGPGPLLASFFVVPVILFEDKGRSGIGPYQAVGPALSGPVGRRHRG